MSPELRDRGPQTIYEKIGPFGLLDVVVRSTPLVWTLTIPFYGFWAYRRVTNESHSIQELLWNHEQKINQSLIFKIARPKFPKIPFRNSRA